MLWARKESHEPCLGTVSGDSTTVLPSFCCVLQGYFKELPAPLAYLHLLDPAGRVRRHSHVLRCLLPVWQHHLHEQRTGSPKIPKLQCTLILLGFCCSFPFSRVECYSLSHTLSFGHRFPFFVCLHTRKWRSWQKDFLRNVKCSIKLCVLSSADEWTPQRCVEVSLLLLRISFQASQLLRLKTT